MKIVFIAFLILAHSFCSFGQDDFMVWTKVSLEKKIIKPLSAEIQFNTRFGDTKVQTFFPQLGLDYKIQKWVSLGVEYRYIVDRNKYTNYHGSSRLNFNLTLAKKAKRYKFSLRTRYQMGFKPNSQSEYNEDFDQAIRLRPYFLYDIKKFFLNPFVSTEIFFNPSYGPNSPGPSKLRSSIGLKLDTKSKHSAAIKYQLDTKFDSSKGFRHVVRLSYGFEL